ncbi:MAG TPA: hypothetical protein VOB72_13055 [Candidatus Dormibacteraeota bacterium]|nr:hypothetical protein [Candidatus Dormibacteraeota bacterium]
MTFGVAALISWLLTAAFGTALLLLWAARSAARPLRRRPARAMYNRPPPYIPRTLVAAHVLVAVAGLAAWTAALVLAQERLAWAAFGSLLVVAVLGAGMFVRWLGSRRARRAARAATGAPAESRLPTAMVLGHGALGVTTVLLVVLSWLRG